MQAHAHLIKRRADLWSLHHGDTKSGKKQRARRHQCAKGAPKRITGNADAYSQPFSYLYTSATAFLVGFWWGFAHPDEFRCVLFENNASLFNYRFNDRTTNLNLHAVAADAHEISYMTQEVTEKAGNRDKNTHRQNTSSPLTEQRSVTSSAEKQLLAFSVPHTFRTRIQALLVRRRLRDKIDTYFTSTVFLYLL